MKRIFLTGLLVLGIAPALLRAADSIYENDGTVTFPSDNVVVDATNFVNTGTFTVNFPTVGQQYKTKDTVNYTNTGTMSAQWGFDLEKFPTGGGSGPASTFYNEGTINAGVDPLVLAIPTRMIVWATNIINPGFINVSDWAQLALSGQTVDLSRSTLSVDTSFAGTTFVDWGVGVTPLSNTVTFPFFAWNPGADLGTFSFTPVFTNASRVKVPQIVLTNAQLYNAVFAVTPTNNNMRGIYVQNRNPNLQTKASLTANPFNSVATIEWSGAVLDPASGAVLNNYLYLIDQLDFTTNQFVDTLNRPFSYSFEQSVGTPTHTVGPPNGPLSIPDENVTNSYAYVSVVLSPTTYSTSSIFGGNITNLPGRVQITATNYLDLTLAQISGPNYLSLNATNQYNGNDGSQIGAAYGDIKLGVTNGIMTVSNLWKPVLPGWSGTVRAWNTHWVSSTGTPGVTNDYEVLVVDSALVPTAPTYLGDVLFHATNTLLISDTLNIMRNLSIDAKNLTLTTNEIGNGANSFDGELNLMSTTFMWSASLPKLKWLTNNGAIRIFSSSAQSFTNDSVGKYAQFINTGLIVDGGSFIWADNFQNSGVLSNTVSFLLRCTNAAMTNGVISAGTGDVGIFANTMVASNLTVRAARTLTLSITNNLSDTGVTNGNIWSVGVTNVFGGNYGINLPVKPPFGDLLGTTISNTVSGGNKQSWNIWAGQDRGYSVLGYSNNVAVGRLILDSFGSSSQFVFTNATAGNAMYVDYLEVRDQATNRDANGNFTQIHNTNGLIIYYAQAIMNGASIAEKMNHKNNDHLRWMPTYNGYFSSTNMVTATTTNTINAALAQSTDIDSDSDGIANAFDSTPFFLPSDVNLLIGMTNIPPPNVRLTFNTVPHATNFVYFSTNMVTWSLLTNFLSPNIYPAPATNVVVLDPVGPVMRFYQVVVNTWLTYPF
jgi:hypothetical protein